jgi:Domain of unknown function (DUF1918)
MNGTRRIDPPGGESIVSIHVGDRLVIESERAGQAGRSCIVEEVLSEQPQRLRVRWDDGRESIFVPSAGVARIAEQARPAAKPRRKAAKA